MTPEQVVEIIKILRSLDIINYIMICVALLIGIMIGKNWV